MYTVSKNGRLNVWECDTKLDGLIKKLKDEDKENVVDGDDLAGKRSLNELNNNDQEVQNMEEDDQEEQEKFTIHYKKVAK